MAGHVLNNLVVINCTSPDIDPENECVHILTHIGRQYSCLREIISHHITNVYTSEFNVWFLTTFFEAKPHNFTAVPLRKKKEVFAKGEKIIFEFIDANHCPGAVMVLIEGNFGSYLYTGNCRYSPSMFLQPSLRQFLRKDQELHRLYVDAAYKKIGAKFPSRELVIQEIIKFISNNKGETIYLCCRLLGKDDILFRIVTELNEKVAVNEHKLRVLYRLGYKSKRFTTDSRIARIRVVEPHNVTPVKMNRRRLKEKCIALVLTAYNFNEDKLKRHGIYVFPASDHNSAIETDIMVNKLKPKEVYFLNYDYKPRSVGGTLTPHVTNVVSSTNASKSSGKTDQCANEKKTILSSGSDESPVFYFNICTQSCPSEDVVNATQDGNGVVEATPSSNENYDKPGERKSPAKDGSSESSKFSFRISSSSTDTAQFNSNAQIKEVVDRLTSDVCDDKICHGFPLSQVVQPSQFKELVKDFQKNSLTKNLSTNKNINPESSRNRKGSEKAGCLNESSFIITQSINTQIELEKNSASTEPVSLTDVDFITIQSNEENNISEQNDKSFSKLKAQGNCEVTETESVSNTVVVAEERSNMQVNRVTVGPNVDEELTEIPPELIVDTSACRLNDSQQLKKNDLESNIPTTSQRTVVNTQESGPSQTILTQRQSTTYDQSRVSTTYPFNQDLYDLFRAKFPHLYGS